MATDNVKRPGKFESLTVEQVVYGDSDGSVAQSNKILVKSSAVVVNEDGSDIDFRVEGDTNTALLFVDAGNDRVGIGKSNPDELLDVEGLVQSTGFQIKTTGAGEAAQWAFRVRDSGNNIIFQIQDPWDTADNVVYVNKRGGDQYFSDDTNTIFTIEGGAAEDTLKLLTGEAVVNETGADVDFRVEGDTDTHLIFVDASEDKVGIGDSTPSYKLDVNGEINAATAYRHNGTQGLSQTYQWLDGDGVT